MTNLNRAGGQVTMDLAAFRGEDVPKAALDSARSLFSYRADSPPPTDHGADGEYAGARLPDGKPVTSLADVLTFGLLATASTRRVIESAIYEARARASTPAVSEESRSRSHPA